MERKQVFFLLDFNTNSPCNIHKNNGGIIIFFFYLFSSMRTKPNPRCVCSIPLELLVNIDNFAHAVKLTWQTEDNVMAILQSLGASTFLALLERSDLMDTLTRQGDRVRR